MCARNVRLRLRKARQRLTVLPLTAFANELRSAFAMRVILLARKVSVLDRALVSGKFLHTSIETMNAIDTDMVVIWAV